MLHSKWTLGSMEIDVGYLALGQYLKNNIAERFTRYWCCPPVSTFLNENCYIGTKFRIWEYINNTHPAFGALKDELYTGAGAGSFICKKIVHDVTSGYWLCACICTEGVGGASTYNASWGLVFIKDTDTIDETTLMHKGTLTSPVFICIGIRPMYSLGTVDDTVFNNMIYTISNTWVTFLNNTNFSESGDYINVLSQDTSKIIPMFMIKDYIYNEVINYNSNYYSWFKSWSNQPSWQNISIGNRANNGEIDPNFNPYNPDPPDPTDPYNPLNPTDDSKQRGGEGDRGDASDTISEPALPGLSASNTGFIRLYHPDTSKLHSLANFLWSTTFDINTLKKLFSDPFDVILGLSMFPLPPDEAGSKNIILGNIDTEISCPYLSNDYKTFDCGTIELKEYYGAYLDYDPYTSLNLYIPYIGYQKISPDISMLKNIGIKYKVDFLSGECIALVLINSNVLYQFTGNMAAQIPITSANYSAFINSMIEMGVTMGASIASAPAKGITGLMNAKDASEIGNVLSQKISYAHGGAASGIAGHMSVRKPYLIIEFPDAIIPADQNSFTGYPAYYNESLNTLSGFTIVADINLSCPGATDEEMNEILQLLKEGVLI